MYYRYHLCRSRRTKSTTGAHLCAVYQLIVGVLLTPTNSLKPFLSLVAWYLYYACLLSGIAIFPNQQAKAVDDTSVSTGVVELLHTR
jgi:hypothetical protein